MAFINGRFLTSSITFWLLTFFFPFSWDNFRYLNYVRKASMSPVSKFFRFVVIELSADILYYFITILITPLVMSHISFPLQILPLSSPLIRLLFLALQISLDFQYSSVVEENVIDLKPPSVSLEFYFMYTQRSVFLKLTIFLKI